MIDDLIAFIRARLDQDEQTARAATPGPWVAVRDPYPDSWSIVSTSGDVVGPDYQGSAASREEDAAHIARWDPARVLAEVDAKRRMVARCVVWIRDAHAGGPRAVHLRIAADLMLRDLAAPYEHHDGYQAAWRPSRMMSPRRSSRDRHRDTHLAALPPLRTPDVPEPG